jgi:hypothetical protein
MEHSGSGNLKLVAIGTGIVRHSAGNGIRWEMRAASRPAFEVKLHVLVGLDALPKQLS